jgi:hypothetical protein
MRIFFASFECTVSAVICIFTGAVSPLMAASVPAQLCGKTINASHTSSTPTISHHTNRPTFASRSIDHTIYVSTACRIFERLSQNSRGGSASKDAAFKWQFEGGKLIGTFAANGRASIVTIGFDSGYQGCTISVLRGHEAGKNNWRGLNGSIYERTGPSSVSGERCSISQGNGL